MTNKKPGFIERFLAWLFEPVNDIVENRTDSIAEEVVEKMKEDQFLEEDDEEKE